jgi:hypothetical protein
MSAVADATKISDETTSSSTESTVNCNPAIGTAASAATKATKLNSVTTRAAESELSEANGAPNSSQESSAKVHATLAPSDQATSVEPLLALAEGAVAARRVTDDSVLEALGFWVSKSRSLLSQFVTFCMS